MRHVDEGGLHAWLDGELDALPASEAKWIRSHLEECAECARRLEEERGVRDAADAALAGAPVDLTGLPTLEEMRAEARRGAGGVAGTGARFRRLAWAASVVLAAGAGWMAKGLTGPVDSIQPLMRSAPLPAEEARMEAQGVQADVQVEEETSAATETGAGAAAERIAPMEVRDADRPGPAQRGETAPEAVVARTQARAAMAPEVLEDADEALKAGEDAEPSVLGVPGLPVLATEFAAPGSPGSGVRVLQELPSGDTLQVYRLPAGTPPAALPPAEPGIVQWEEARDAGWVVLRARLDATELQRLAGRVR